MMNLLGPLAVVSYAVSAIVGFSFAILLTAAWKALDMAVTRLAIRQRGRRPRAKTVVQIGGKRNFFQ